MFKYLGVILGLVMLSACGSDCDRIDTIVYSTPSTVYTIPPRFNIGELVYTRMPNGIICNGRIINRTYNNGFQYLLNPVVCYGYYYYNIVVSEYNLSRGY
jgi:hypothetical protein